MAEADFQKATIAIDYSPISEKVLGETSIIRQISNKDILGNISEGTQLKVFVHGLATIADYVTGTGVVPTSDASDYVLLNNQKDKVINELLDGLTVEQAYDSTNHVAGRLEAALMAIGEQMDTDGYNKMLHDVATLGTEVTAVTTGDIVEVSTVTDIDDAQWDTIFGSAYQPVVGDIFVCAATDGDISTAGGVKIFTDINTKPTDGTETYGAILTLKTALDTAKAPQTGRSLVMTPEMLNLLLEADSKITLSTNRGDKIQATGWVGMFLGFNIYMTTLMPAGLNMLAIQERAFAHTDDWTTGVFLQSLDSSAQFVGDSAIKGRFAYNNGTVRADLIQLNLAG